MLYPPSLLNIINCETLFNVDIVKTRIWRIVQKKLINISLNKEMFSEIYQSAPAKYFKI